MAVILDANALIDLYQAEKLALIYIQTPGVPMIEEDNNKTRIVSLPVPEELVRSAEFVGEELGWDSHEILLQWLRAGTEREMLKMVSAGELSTGKFVELLGITYFDVAQLTEKYNIEIGPTEEQVQYMWDKHAEAVSAILKKSVKSQQEQQD